MSWPPQSPDLSPIENVWVLLTQRVYADGWSYRTTNELWEAVSEECEKLTAADMAAYYQGMHHRVVKVIERNGRKIDH